MTMQTCEPKSVDLYFWKTVAQAWSPTLPAEPDFPVRAVLKTRTPEQPASTFSAPDKVMRGFVTVTGSLCTQAVELDDDDEDELLAELGRLKR